MAWRIDKYSVGAKREHLTSSIKFPDGVPCAAKFFEIGDRRGEYPFSYRYELIYVNDDTAEVKVVDSVSSNFVLNEE